MKLLPLLFLPFLLFAQNENSALFQFGGYTGNDANAVSEKLNYDSISSKTVASTNEYLNNGLTSDLESVIKQEMGVPVSIKDAEYAFSKISEIDFNSIDFNSFDLKSLNMDSLDFSNVNIGDLRNLGSITGINGMENLEYLDVLDNYNFNEIGLKDFGDIKNFDFNAIKFDSMFTVDSVMSKLGLGDVAKDKIQELIILNSQNSQQLSGQNIKYFSMNKLDVEEILMLKQIQFNLFKNNLIKGR